MSFVADVVTVASTLHDANDIFGLKWHTWGAFALVALILGTAVILWQFDRRIVALEGRKPERPPPEETP